MAKKIGNYIYISIALLCSAMVAILVILTVTRMLSSSQPVMTYIKPSGLFEISPNAVEANFIGKKQRNCRRIPESEMGYCKDGALIHETTMTYIDDNTPNSSFPEGVINLGRIRWDVPLGIRPTEVGFTVAHECGDSMTPSQFWFEVE